ncbi:GNAT family N-acetyltransferase [Vibrio sp. DW001]|uniref:GNAT family N-acetyltransferase n=1 Tax=Vibrio sp. DW001 TaxID=2912315 RepID=UPI0023B10B7E|nr:GNAT family N-acetyltransferase [Vibrio sp. DW001]WED25250.1 GNAT family N-acetyltransferase [Vibrio sp. DW001]
MEISLHLVRQKDAEALLKFEVDNKRWFEEHVPSREDRFYSLSGVKQQISDFLIEYDNGLMYPMLIKNDIGTICGRINLHRIDDKREHGEMGYRIGRSYTSQGVASSAVRKLLTLLTKTSGLKYVNAIALVSNVGSNKILTKNGFHLVQRQCNYTELNGHMEDANQYQRVLS